MAVNIDHRNGLFCLNESNHEVKLKTNPFNDDFRTGKKTLNFSMYFLYVIANTKIMCVNFAVLFDVESSKTQAEYFTEEK